MSYSDMTEIQLTSKYGGISELVSWAHTLGRVGNFGYAETGQNSIHTYPWGTTV